MKRMALFLMAVTLNAYQSVAFVDAARFSGLWYEIARTYNSYQKNCVASSVEYTLVAPLKYRVNNRCFEHVIGGDLIEYEGDAQPSEGDSMSRIEMTYFWIFTKEYHVIYIEEDYSRAIVADRQLEQVWIMSRTPHITQEQRDVLLAKLDPLMDLSRLIYTPQDEKGRYK
jgi:apolipoprotein D and lipocalin family protein